MSTLGWPERFERAVITRISRETKRQEYELFTFTFVEGSGAKVRVRVENVRLHADGPMMISYGMHDHVFDIEELLAMFAQFGLKAPQFERFALYEYTGATTVAGDHILQVRAELAALRDAYHERRAAEVVRVREVRARGPRKAEIVDMLLADDSWLNLLDACLRVCDAAALNSGSLIVSGTTSQS